MLTLLAWLVLLTAVWISAFYRLKPKYWIPGFGLLLVFYSMVNALHLVGLILCWIIWALISILIIIPSLRCWLVTMPLLKWFRQQQPPLSQAEKEVLESGGLWWETEFFSGNPDWQKLYQMEKPHLTREEQTFIDDQVEVLCAMLNDWEIVHEKKDLPPQVWSYIKKEKFWGLGIEKKSGGLGFSPLAHSAIISKIASRSISAAFMVMVPNSLGPSEFLQHYGSEEQKEYYLPRLACGEEIPCFALTAPEAGSDATSIQDSGIICKGEHEGQEIIGIRLSWDKRYITLAPIATLLGVAFKLYDPDHLIGEKKYIGITLALIPAQHPGVEVGHRHFPLNLSFMNGPARGKDVFIPLEWIIGGRERAGKGWQMMMECLAIGRGISLPAVSSATIKFCLRTTTAYAWVRRQFNRSIAEFDGIKIKLAEMAGFAYLSEAVRLFTAQAVTSGVRPAVASAMAKYHLTELARVAANHAMDIHAGRAIQLGPRNYLASFYNSLPICVTVEGANILTRSLIIFGQGVVRAHPYLRDELAAASDPEESRGCRKFNEILLAHSGFLLSQFARLIIYGLTGGRTIWVVEKKSSLKKYYQQLTRLSNAFAVVTDVTLIVMGNKLKIKETLSARLGDIVSYLYFASATLKYFHDNGETDEDQLLVDWVIQYCFYQIQNALMHFLQNFPRPGLAKCLSWLIFPWGEPYYYPCDELAMQIAHKLQDQRLRDRLSRYCYIGKDSDDPSGRMELAFAAIKAAIPIYSKIKSSNAGLTDEEKAIIAHAEKLCQDAIAVDEFTKL